MKLNFKNSVKGIGLGLFMMFGITAFSTTEANAQWRDRDDDRYERQDDRDYRRDRRDDRDDRYERRDRRNNRNDRYGNNGGYYGNNIYREAQRQGYQDGLYRGRDDAQDRDRYNPEKSSEYRKATNGYDSRMGNKNAYKDAYRQAFISGYNQGYNRGRYNGGNNNRRSTGAAILGSILGF